MYKSDELETFPAQVEKIFNALSNDVMSDVIERIRENDEITRTGDWRLYRLHQMGANMDTIAADIQTALDLADEDMQRLYSDVLKEGYARNEQMYKAMNKPFIPYEKNEQLQQLIGAVKSQTGNEFRNITGTMGFTVKNVAGTSEFVPTNEYIQKVLDEAAMHVLNGTYDYNSMIKRVVDEMTKSGVRTIEYSSGYSTRIDVAARRAIVTGLNQVTSRISEDNMEKLDTQFVETSWHSTARPSHQEWQGRVFYWNKSNVNEEITIDGIHYKAFIKETGYGTVEGLCGANCYHTFYPFIPGVSVRNYTDEELDQMNAAENEVKEYNGKEYTKYEATQEQRRLERTLRKLRQDIDLMEKAGLTDEDEELVGKKCKYQTYMRRYKDFSKEMGLKEHWERVTVDGLNSYVANNQGTKDEIVHQKTNGSVDLDKSSESEKGDNESSDTIVTTSNSESGMVSYSTKSEYLISTNSMKNNQQNKSERKIYDDVTNEYLEKATPGKGSIIFDKRVKDEDKDICRWIHRLFGGDIHCLDEQSQVGKMPDAKWNGIYWEFKRPTTKNAIDDRIRAAQKQLYETLQREGNENEKRGMIIDISDRKITQEEAIEIIIARTISRAKATTDVIIKEQNDIVKIFRCHK